VAEESPTQNALNTAWDNIAQLNSAIDQLSKRLEPVISSGPTAEDGCQEEAKTLIGSPLTVNIQRIGNSVANARIRLAEITARLEL
jgi:molybdopterin-biosynthesis enzyme MoeA-like protein